MSARIRSTAPRGAALNVVAVEREGNPPVSLLVPLEAPPKPAQESSEEDFDASILTLQAMFSVPRRVAARALARARLRLPVAIEILLDNAKKDELIVESGLVVPAVAAPDPKSPAAASRPTPPTMDNLMSFDANLYATPFFFFFFIAANHLLQVRQANHRLSLLLHQCHRSLICLTYRLALRLCG